MRCTLRVGASALAVMLLWATAAAQDRVAELRALFAERHNAVEKARLMPELGEAEFRDLREDVVAGRLGEALKVLEQYRAEARECSQGLDAMKVDAEKHPAGFKQLQISLRESLRRLNEILAGLTLDDEAPFLEVRKDLEELNQHLIGQLFPRQAADREPKKREN